MKGIQKVNTWIYFIRKTNLQNFLFLYTWLIYLKFWINSIFALEGGMAKCGLESIYLFNLLATAAFL